MRTLRVPEGVTSVSFVNEYYWPENGLVHVSDEAAAVLIAPPHNFTPLENAPEPAPAPIAIVVEATSKTKARAVPANHEEA